MPAGGKSGRIAGLDRPASERERRGATVDRALNPFPPAWKSFQVQQSDTRGKARRFPETIVEIANTGAPRLRYDADCVTNNDILRRIRYVFDFEDAEMIALFALGGRTVTRAEVSGWLKRDGDPDGKACRDVALAAFLNGFIVRRRGAREGSAPAPETRLTNNIILRKLKAALEFRSEDVIEVVALAGFPLSKHELSALFRTPEHRQYRECKDQLLRNFLKGLQLKYRGA
jgi:uncharacterized protein YehS (DUF1456 family)